MKIFKIELITLDNENYSEKNILDYFKTVCPFPIEVRKVESRDIEWNDNHPLNNESTKDAELSKLFPSELDKVNKAIPHGYKVAADTASKRVAMMANGLRAFQGEIERLRTVIGKARTVLEDFE
jgi:GMP synthase-like glutamine amidotransferase